MLLHGNQEANESIYVIDLGEAQLSKKSDEEKLNSTTFKKQGTRLYMAPERFGENSKGTHQSDLW